jgi:hypothetical protein
MPIYVDLPDGDESEIENKSDDDIGDPDFHVFNKTKNETNESDDESNKESSESDNDDADKPKTSAAAKKSKKKQLKWERDTFASENTEWKSKLPNPPEVNAIEPFEIFRTFMPRSVFDWIRDETNKYSEDKQGESIQVTTDEIEQYIGILFFMSVVAMPRYDMYWAAKTYCDQVGSVMSRDRFEEIKRFFHLCDNSELTTTTITTTRQARKVIRTETVIATEQAKDKLFKVRFLLDHVRSKCLEISPEENNSIDEQIIPYKGKTSSMRQYNPKKPKKWGFKSIARCGASGILYDFFIYTGKSIEKPTESVAANSVIKLVETLPEHQNFKIYFDNWFSTIGLAIKLTLSGHYFVGQ